MTALRLSFYILIVLMIDLLHPTEECIVTLLLFFLKIKWIFLISFSFCHSVCPPDGLSGPCPGL